MDWSRWNEAYDVSPSLRARLQIVRRQISAALNETGSGEFKIISLCAGDGCDVIGALENHPRRNAVRAWLVELNPELVARGRTAAERFGLGQQIQFAQSDASRAASYSEFGHAELVLVSGMLGHLALKDALGLIENLPMLCKSGADVIWNRHRTLNDGARQIEAIRDQFRRCDFEEMDFEITSPDSFAVGRMRFRGARRALDATKIFFTFTGLERFLKSELQEQPAEVDADGNGRNGFAATMNIEQSIPECFERVASLFPERPAIIGGAWQASYRELNTAADALAKILAAHGRAGDRVAVLMKHDDLEIAAVLGALKAGRVVVVMNPGDPPARLAQVVADAEPVSILTDAPNWERSDQIAGGKISVVCLDESDSNFRLRANGARTDRAPEANTQTISPADLAFIVYTSGSTGRPKGVMQTHRNILHNIFRLTVGMKLCDADRIILLASLSGAQGVATTWCALLNGAALCPFSAMERGVTGLKETILAQAITVYVSSASLFRHFIRTLAPHEVLSLVRMIRLGAESSTSDDFAGMKRHFRSGCVLFHSLSSSETGYIAQLSLRDGDDVEPGRLPVGRAAEGIEILLLDENGTPARAGETGEMVVRGRFLSPGYWRNESLTAQKFSGRPGDKLRDYRSGDLGKFRADGLLMHMGRKDAQVKIRGYRIELQEVEDALARLPEVEKAIVFARHSESADAQLIACVIPRSLDGFSAESLRAQLQPALPNYMIPGGFIFLRQFPLTPHGKIDRDALRHIEPQMPSRNFSDPPSSETEILVAAIWRDVFKREMVSRNENFFALGGDSLNAVVVAARIYERIKIELPLSAFAAHPTLAALAAAVDELRRAAREPSTPPLVRVPRAGPLPMSFEQERTWRHARKSQEASDSYNVATSYGIRGTLDAGAFRECLNELATRHETLRTTFDDVNGQPVQVIQPPAPVAFEEMDFSAAADAEEQAQRVFREKSRQSCDLRRGPLIRFWLAKIRADEHWLLTVTHHIILDAWSWRVFFGELGAMCEAKISGRSSLPLDSERLQYADYAAWQRRMFQSDQRAFAETIAWWRERSAAEPRFGGLLELRPRATKLPLKRFWRARSPNEAEGLLWWGIKPEISRRLDEIGRESHATFFVTRLAAFAALAAAATRQDEVILGTYVTNRNRVELQNMFGFFVNLTVLRMRVGRRWTFREWLSEVSRVVNETRAHAEMPYDELCRELRSVGTKPLKFRATFAVSDHTAPIRFGGLELTWRERFMQVMPAGFHLTFDQHNEDRRCWAAFDPRIYHPRKVRSFIERLTRVLDAVSRQPKLRIGDLPQ